MAEFLDSRTLGASASGAFEAPAAQRIGRFELRREIARGGMGIVFEAYDPDLRQRVALKLLHPWSAADDETRFRREAQVIARLRHPNVVRVYALGRDCGRSYLVLDYVDGESLAQRLERVGGTLSGLEAIDVLEPIARAAHYAHCRGVVHRDLKPANVLLPRLGGPQLVDFGLAKDLTASNPLTQHGELLGTPPYMAPEQVVGAPLDSRTDVYGLGATLYRTLTGRHPYDGALLEVLDAVVNAPVPCPSDVVEVDPRLAAISRRCMAKDPAQRYPTAEAVAEALAACRAPALSLRVFGSTFALPAAATFFYGRAPEETPPGTRLLRRRSLLPMAASLVAACAVLPLAGLLLSGDGRRGAVAAKEGASERVARGASPRLERLEEGHVVLATLAVEEELAPTGVEPASEPEVEPLRETGSRSEVEVPSRETADAPAANRGPAAADAPGAVALPGPAVYAELESGAGSALEVTPLIALGPEPPQASIAPEVSARRAAPRSFAPEPAPALVSPGLPSFVEPEPVADAVSVALASYREPLPAAAAPYAELLTLDGRGSDYRSVPLSQTLGRSPSALLVAFDPLVFAAQGAQVDWLLADEVRRDAVLPAEVASVAVVRGEAFVGTRGADAGDVYRRSVDGRWDLSYDGSGELALCASLQGELYAVEWSAAAGARVLRRERGRGQATWVAVGRLGSERPTRVASSGSALWVACASESADALALYAGGGNTWRRVELGRSGSSRGRQAAEVTALLPLRGNLFASVVYRDPRSGRPEGGELLAGALDGGRLELERLGERLPPGDAPLSLAFHEATLYVGTQQGRLLYLRPDGDRDAPRMDELEWGEDPAPGSLGVHSLIPRQNGALLLGLHGPGSSEVAIRVRGVR